MKISRVDGWMEINLHDHTGSTVLVVKPGEGLIPGLGIVVKGLIAILLVDSV